MFHRLRRHLRRIAGGTLLVLLPVWLWAVCGACTAAMAMPAGPSPMDHMAGQHHTQAGEHANPCPMGGPGPCGGAGCPANLTPIQPAAASLAVLLPALQLVALPAAAQPAPLQPARPGRGRALALIQAPPPPVRLQYGVFLN